ncbi:MAG TPA: S-methyl-5-thioribose-1-phosphate isomerase [Desulfomicrobiaceae bacterium]|nr:S-methyl-5-thioribose-1-phosphate isomerase [Desulfomicrobiaceae bacterium]
MEHHIQFSGEKNALILLDQRYLPTREEWFYCRTVAETIEALQVMVVRGAPAIGVTAAYGCYLATQETDGKDPDWAARVDALLDDLAAARPTAVNLTWAVNLLRGEWKAKESLDLHGLAAYWLARAREIHAEDIRINTALGRLGGELLRDGDTVMTHCNAGALATAGYGTALGVVRGAVDAGKKIEVIANETRPFLQGARLTAYELQVDGIPVKVACDNACALLMQRGLVDAVVVGADRIVANGDTANKIGTFGVALLAKHFGVPFYVAAPGSTFDLDTPDGSGIPIEDRTPNEVTHVGETRITPESVPVFNYAFDVTPADLIAGIVTEKGVLRPPYVDSIARTIGGSGR